MDSLSNSTILLTSLAHYHKYHNLFNLFLLLSIYSYFTPLRDYPKIVSCTSANSCCGSLTFLGQTSPDGLRHLPMKLYHHLHFLQTESSSICQVSIYSSLWAKCHQSQVFLSFYNMRNKGISSILPNLSYSYTLRFHCRIHIYSYFTPLP